MSLRFKVKIPGRRPVERCLLAALATLEADCPPREDWFVAVIGSVGVAAPIATVFRIADPEWRSTGPIQGWTYNDNTWRTGQRRPTYWKRMPYFPQISGEQWAAEVTEEVRVLLRALSAAQR